MHLTAYLEHYTYIGILTSLVASGVGFPISEDIILLSCGVLIYCGIIRALLALPICYFGVICSDLILYTYGWRYGENIMQGGWLSRFIDRKSVGKVKNYFDGHGNKTIFLARHLAVLRSLIFLLAGAMKVKPHNFLLMDGLGAFLSVPLFTTLGYLFANQIDRLQKGLIEIEYLVATVLIFGVISFFTWQRYCKMGKQPRE